MFLDGPPGVGRTEARTSSFVTPKYFDVFSN